MDEILIYSPSIENYILPISYVENLYVNNRAVLEFPQIALCNATKFSLKGNRFCKSKWKYQKNVLNCCCAREASCQIGRNLFQRLLCYDRLSFHIQIVRIITICT